MRVSLASLGCEQLQGAADGHHQAPLAASSGNDADGSTAHER